MNENKTELTKPQKAIIQVLTYMMLSILLLLGASGIVGAWKLLIMMKGL